MAGSLEGGGADEAAWELKTDFLTVTGSLKSEPFVCYCSARNILSGVVSNKGWFVRYVDR